MKKTPSAWKQEFENRLSDVIQVDDGRLYLFLFHGGYMLDWMRVTQRNIIRAGLKKRSACLGLGILAGALRMSRALRKRSSTDASALGVLILEPYGMGDVITLEPLVRCLRENGYAVRLSAQASWRALYPGSLVSEWLDAREPWSSYNEREKYRRSSLWNPSFKTYLRELRHLGTGALGIDPRGDIRSVLLLHLAGCRKVLSLENYLGADLRVPACAAELVPCPDDLRRWEVNLLFLKLLGVPDPKTHSPPRFEHFRVCDENKISHRIGLVPIAPWSGKFWERTKWVELIEALSARGLEPGGFCGPGQAAATKGELGKTVPVEECPNVQTWANRLGTCRCVVSVDSGPMHLADALGIPVIALFGQGKLPLWAPSGPNSRVISHQQDPDFFLCHPIEENAHLGRKFMSRISVNEVLSAVRSVMVDDSK